MMYWHTLRNGGLSKINQFFDLNDVFSLPLLVILEHLLLIMSFVMHRFMRKTDAYTELKIAAEEYSQNSEKYREANKQKAD